MRHPNPLPSSSLHLWTSPKHWVSPVEPSALKTSTEGNCLRTAEWQSFKDAAWQRLVPCVQRPQVLAGLRASAGFTHPYWPCEPSFSFYLKKNVFISFTCKWVGVL